jgi:long-chain acyl-CoA synthetase
MLQGMVMMMGQQVREDSSYVVSGPMFHIGVLQAMFSTFMIGGTNIFIARMDAEKVLEIIAAERVTHAYIPPPTIAQMRELNRDGAYDVSSLFSTPDMSDWTGTACVPANAPMQKAPSGYGQTELSGLAVLNWLGGTGAGLPAPFLQVRILNDDGAEVPDGEVGEICARGAMVMCGYWGRAEENARRTQHGWHRTNDLGFRKEDGSIVFVGPKTTMVKSGLENIYPAEVEACIKAHAGVQEVCVIGTPDPVWAQNVRAVIVLKPGAACREDEIIEHCRARIASYKKPKSVVFVDSLPKNAFGFVDRTAVDALHEGGGYPKAGA